jgi:hypothetical protein
VKSRVDEIAQVAFLTRYTRRSCRGNTINHVNLMGVGTTISWWLLILMQAICLEVCDSCSPLFHG